MRDVVTRVVLDVDTGIDDALALLYAVAHPALDLGAVTCVSGNVALRQVVQNTCSVLDLAEARDVPVGSGTDTTLLGQGARPGHRHGANGLGDLPVQASGREPQPDTAVELLSDQLLHAERPVTLLALAPKTNLAMLVRDRLAPIASTVEKLIFVGGRLTKVHTAQSAEFNVAHDPEAAAIILGAGLPTTMYGADIFNQVVVSEAATARLAQADQPAARLAGDLLRVRHGRLIEDAGALVMLTNPELFKVQRAPVRIGLHGAERGRTLIDPAAPIIDVVTAVDAAQAAQRFVDVVLDGEE